MIQILLVRTRKYVYIMVCFSKYVFSKSQEIVPACTGGHWFHAENQIQTAFIDILQIIWKIKFKRVRYNEPYTIDNLLQTWLNIEYFMVGSLFIGYMVISRWAESDMMWNLWRKVLFGKVMGEIRIGSCGPIYGNLTQWPGVWYYDYINNTYVYIIMCIDFYVYPWY